MTRTKNFQARVLFVHRWTGLIIGTFVLLSAISGMGLAFRKQLEPATYAELMKSGRCDRSAPLDLLVANAERTYSGSPAQYIRIFGDPTAAARVRFGGNDTLYLDRCTGKVLGDMNRYSGIFGRIEQLHTLRYWKIGSAIAGSWSLAFAFLLIIAGVYIAWPMLRGRPRQALTLNRRLEGRAWNINLHRTLALYATPIVLMSALTAVPQGLEWVENALYKLDATPTAPPPVSSPVSGQRITIEQARRIADRAWPMAQEMLIQLPRKPDAPYEIYAIARDAWHANARNYIYVDAWSGNVLSQRPYAQLGLGSKIYYAAISLHTGMPAGIIGQLALFLAALVLTLVIYSGYASYLRGRLQKRTLTHVNQPAFPLLAVKVIRVRDEAPNVRSFELAAAEDDGLPPFTPGSHIDVHCAPGIVRQYSLVNGPEDTASYCIAVRLDPASRGGSATLHHEIGDGDLLTISAPRNHFPLAPNASHHLLIAGGIGITPILSMARHLEAGGASWELHYFVRSAASAAYAELLSAEPLGRKVTVHEGIDPRHYDEILKSVIGAHHSGAHLYHCGGRAFMAAVEEAAAALEWPPESVHHEYFAADSTAWSAPRKAFEIELAKSGRIIHVPADRSIVEALAECGIPTMTSCGQGVCGTCLVKVLAGEIDHHDAFLGQDERHQGDQMLICVSRARSRRLTVDM